LTAAVLKDSANADHTFTPNDITGGVALLVESTGVPIGDSRLTISTGQTPAGRRKVTVKLAVPVVQDAVVSGVTRPTVVRTAYCNMDFSFDGSSNTEERSDILAFIASLMGNTMFKSVANDLQGLY